MNLEDRLLRAGAWTAAGLVASTLGLLIGGKPLLPLVLVHLSLLTLFGLGLAWSMAPADRYFPDRRFSMLGTEVVQVVLVTGAVALVALASSAALRLDPSLQFLQLLSALDIAWSTSAVLVGVRRRWGNAAGVSAGAALAVVCVWSIGRYLSIVGFGPGGAWIVSADALWRYVLPFDIMAALLAAFALLAGARHPIEQRKPQS